LEVYYGSPYLKGIRAPTEPSIAEEENNNEVEEVLPSEPQEWEMRQDFYDITYLQFPRRNRRPQSDEQFGKFMEVIQKLYVNIPLLNTI
jgi:predicted secreted protein